MNSADEWVVTGAGGSALDAVVEQLWSAPVASAQVRVVADAAPNPDWEDVESYWIVPSLRRPQLLVPRGIAKVTSSALRSYQALRPLKTRLVRRGLGLWSLPGLPPALHTLSVQRSADTAGSAGSPLLPLEAISAHLGQGPLHAAIGVRLGDNRKPTLQLFDGNGRPVGYAKLAWNETSREFIETETRTLTAIASEQGPMLAPRLLAAGEWNGFPYLVTEPLPRNVRAVRGRVARPTAQEMFHFSPVVRHDTITATAHFCNVSARIGGLPDAPSQELRFVASELEAGIRARNAHVPVALRWHGDMVPWNAAREPSGQLWCWDWESAEPDAVAGLDAVHWEFSVRREAGDGEVVENFRAGFAAALPYLRAVGVPPSAEADVAAVYALVVAERAWTLATYNGGWAGSWISQQELVALLRAAAAELKVRVS